MRKRKMNYFAERAGHPLITPTNQIKLYPLNGFISHPNIEMYSGDNGQKKFREIVSKYDLLDNFQWILSDIKFAWEQNTNFDSLELMIRSSGTIVLIGYSLPLYNRLIDIRILNVDILANKKIYIQDINPTSIAETLESDFRISYKDRTKGEAQIILSDNCKSFIVPNSIFANS